MMTRNPLAKNDRKMYMASKVKNCVSSSAQHDLFMHDLHLSSMRYMNCIMLTIGNSVNDVAIATLSMLTNPKSCSHRSLLGLFSSVYGCTVLSKMFHNCQN